MWPQYVKGVVIVAIVILYLSIHLAVIPLKVVSQHKAHSLDLKEEGLV